VVTHRPIEDVFVRVASHLGYFGRHLEQLVDVLVGGQYGSEGKGNIASYLAPEYDVLVRVGGPNAGHKVYLGPSKNVYAFHLLPSGTFHNPKARLVLGPGTTLWIPTLEKEVADCKVDKERLSIDPQAMIIDQADRDFEERTLKKTIASTAQGVGAAHARKVLRHKFPNAPRVKLAKDVGWLSPFVKDTRAVLDDAFRAGQRVFLEGTQGTGLSLHHGRYPHVTSRDTTVSGCLADAGIAPTRVRRTIMVCRTYPIRVQNTDAGKTSGYMSHEITYRQLSERSEIPLAELLKTEKTTAASGELESSNGCCCVRPLPSMDRRISR
jgi:adenylosuccinate synthase